MSKVTLVLVAAAALAGCATTHKERVAVAQAASPRFIQRAPSDGRLWRKPEAMPLSAFPDAATRGVSIVPGPTNFGTAANQHSFQR